MSDWQQTAFDREVEMYEPLLGFFSAAGLVVAEVPFFGKRIDLLFATPSLLRLYAVETKLSDWRSAFKQAALNQLASQRSYVAVPSGLAVRLAERESGIFRRYDVGLIGVSQTCRVVIPARKNGCFNLRHYRMLKDTVRPMEQENPQKIGVAADVIAARAKTLVVLQAGIDKGKGSV